MSARAESAGANANNAVPKPRAKSDFRIFYSLPLILTVISVHSTDKRVQ